jgi:hypothetical protein
LDVNNQKYLDRSDELPLKLRMAEPNASLQKVPFLTVKGIRFNFWLEKKLTLVHLGRVIFYFYFVGQTTHEESINRVRFFKKKQSPPRKLYILMAKSTNCDLMAAKLIKLFTYTVNIRNILLCHSTKQLYAALTIYPCINNLNK